MPKEIIQSDSSVYGPESSAISILEVRWSRESEFVEIGSRIVRADDHSDYIPTEEEYPGHSEEAIRGLYTSLSRININKFIRDLRRARDQAFGADA